MAPQKRKIPHDAGAERSVSDAPPRRSTRQHPAPDAEPGRHQSRSGRIRVTNVEISNGGDVPRSASRSRKTDATKQRGASYTDPAVATIPSTRTTRHDKVAASADIGADVSPILVVSKENVRPPTPPEDEVKHAKATPVQTKLSRYYGRADKPSNSYSHSPSNTRRRRPSSTSQPHAFTPRSSQRPTAPTPGAPTATTTPKRTASHGAKIAKLPGTPRSDRNIDEIVFGNTCFKAWYPSYYGKEVLGEVSANAGGNARIGGGKRDQPLLDRLYICPCCFKYAKEAVPWRKHVEYCERKGHVPGTKIYTHPRRSKMVRVPRADSAETSPSAAAKGKGKGKSGDMDQATGAAVSEGEWSVWEVDGGKDGLNYENQLFCQNLSLFAKLFLDNKSVFFDVTGFNYFLLVYTPPALPETHTATSTTTEAEGAEGASSTYGRTNSTTRLPADPENGALANNTSTSTTTATTTSAANTSADVVTSITSHPRPQIVGFFSKEQMSWDNNNLACILVFPPWQRKGLGALLMGVSYEISRREGILGGPEKPISELGRKGYKRFWAGEITRWILELNVPKSAPSSSSVESGHATRHTRKEKDGGEDGSGSVTEHEGLVVDVEQCSRDTWIVPEDCLAVLREMGVVEEDGLGSAYEAGHENRSADTLTTAPRIRIDKAAVRKWARENGIDLTRACDPDGFVEGYAIRRDGDGEEEE